MICLYGIIFNIINVEAKYKYYVYLLYQSVNRDFDNMGTEKGIKAYFYIFNDIRLEYI